MTAESGAGQVTLRWEPVRGAQGYLVHRAPSPDGPWELVDHGGRDVMAFPSSPYVDTTGAPAERYWYALASLSSIEASPGELSTPVEAEPGRGPAEPLELVVRAATPAGRLEPVWHMLGSEHLSLLGYEDEVGGRRIGADLEEAFRLARAELGAETVRAHAILHDELGTYREEKGAPVYDFSGVERVYDRLLATEVRPIVELSFMPRDLAREPSATVFEYEGIISPPRDWGRWEELVRRLTEHLVSRYGLEEVRRFGFEVWNEPNLEVFWSGTQEEYFRLYAHAARAVKAVDDALVVGGPSSAAAGWIEDFLDFVVNESVPFDFISTHTYANLPLDVRQALEVRGLDGVRVWWTEWGVSPSHNARVDDLPFGAPFVLHGVKRVQGRSEALAYWVLSDHFEEVGRPERLFHGGFGLLTVGNLRKPRWWALRLAEELGRDLVAAELTGDGAGSLVDCFASRHPDGGVDVLLWNGTIDQSKSRGEPLLDRTVRLRIEELASPSYVARVARVAEAHSNIVRHWHGRADWPTEDEWRELAERDRLDEEELSIARHERGAVELELALPMPAVARVRLSLRD